MSVVSKTNRPRLKFHRQAYLFVSESLQYAQERLGRKEQRNPEDDGAHVSGPELLEGIRILGVKLFGMLAPTVFRHWGIHSTHDFGRVVFELIELGEMRKTDRDQLSDFGDIYDFDEVFCEHYRIDTSKAFRN